MSSFVEGMHRNTLPGSTMYYRPHITIEIEKPKTTKHHNKDASMVTTASFWTSQNNGNLDVTMPD